MKQYLKLLFVALLCPILSFAQELNQSVYFAPAEFALTNEESLSIKQFLANLPKNKTAYDILLVGHTDNVGNEEYNNRLSKQRCKAVKDYLLSEGITVSQLAYEGKGYHKPVATNETVEGKAQNRRVEMVLMPRGAFSDAPVQVAKEKIVFDAKDGVNYIYQRSGSEIRIPADALVYADGSPVEGEVEVSYREFRDAADFIATDIPMMFDHQHQFESAGMFELTASQEGRELFVKEGAYVDVEFMMTSDSVENVNFYEYRNNKWATLGALDRTSQENTFDVNAPCKQLFRYKMPPLKQDTLTTFLNAMRTGYYLSKEKDFEQFYRIGFLTMDERFKDVRYAGNQYLHYKTNKIDWDALEESSAMLPISFSYNEAYIQTDAILKEIKLPEGLWMEFKSSSRKNEGLATFPEMQELVKRKWMVLPKGKYQPSERAQVLKILSEKYMDIRVSYLGNNTFQFVLKGIAGIDTLEAQPVFERVERKKKEVVSKLLIANYNRNFEKRSKRFDDRIEFYEENWKYFLAFSKSIMPAREQCQSINGWVKHFERNRRTMEARYYAYSGLDENAPDLTPFLARAVAGTPIPLDNPPLPPSQRLGQRLSINGFGVFNCDAIERLGPERVSIAANFVNEEGEAIDAKTINVIDYKINSILRLYDGSKILFNPKRKTAFVVTDFFGDVYVVNAEEVAAIKLNKGQNDYELKASALVLNTVDAIRGAIASN